VGYDLPAGQTGKVKLSIHYKGPLRAPIAKGEPVAELEIAAEGMRPSRVSLMAAEDVPVANGFERLLNGVAGLL
jgi:D-alanyl-D-alanine carboxypeptidase (penicillin-binding protein 5/6)